jgi:quercetin dioxygenase-like cupin family protein
MGKGMPHIKLQDASPHELFAGFHGRFVQSATMTFIHWEIDAGAVLPVHSHPHEQVAHVLDGEFEITIDAETHQLRAGSVAIIPSHAMHSGKALTACRIIDAFYPIRDDYREYGAKSC